MCDTVKRASRSFEEGRNDRDGRFTECAVLFPDVLGQTEGRFFSSQAGTDVHVRNLPHWAQDGRLVFVTFRLADSVPEATLRQWEEEKELWMEHHPEPWDESTRREFTESFPRKFQDYLDAGHGSCILASGGCRRIVETALEHFDGDRYCLHAYVVMPNHVHVLMEVFDKEDLVRVMHSWKSFTPRG